MNLHKDQLVELYTKAIKDLNIKTSRIPARAFPSGRKPTIRDIYERPHTLYRPEIHPNLQIFFFFAHYNSFVAANFRARKLEQAVIVTMAIWYWQMDQLHSLTLSHQVTRFNVLLAHIAVSSPCAEQDLGSGLYHFLTNFVMAWLDAALGVKHGEDLTRDYFITRVWKKGMYDLVRWRPMQISRMKAAVKKLETVVPECTVSGEQFWEEVVNRPVEEHRKHGRVWAMQYIIYMERKAEGFKKDDQLRQADENLSSGDFAGAFAGLGVGDEAPDCLSEELFEREEVKALLVDVEDVMVQQPEENVPWMDPSAAIDVLEGNIDGVGDLMRTMESSFRIHTDSFRQRSW